MATLGASLPTLVDLAKSLDPDGKVAKIAELLSQTNEVLSDMPWQEGNLTTGHRVSVRTGLPTVAWRLLNQGVAVSKGTSAQIDEACGMLEARSQVDEILARLSNDVSAFRLSQAVSFIEAMNIEMAQTLFYGNSGTAPEEFTGLSTRYSAISGAGNADCIVDADGTGSDNSSIWLCCWGPGVYGIYPKGTKGGLEHQDLGLADAFDSSNNRFRAYMDLWRWNCGIALADWRYVVRICNIDISNLVAKSSAADLPDNMIDAIHRIPGGYAGMNMGKPVFYMNRTTFKMLQIQLRDDVISGGQLSYDVVSGKRVPSFMGIPIRICDALLETESRVT